MKFKPQDSVVVSVTLFLVSCGGVVCSGVHKLFPWGGGAHVKLNGGPWVSKVQQNTYI